MKFTPVKTPSFFKHAFPDAVWRVPTTNKIIYLTFDDGPTPLVTDWVLDTLSEYNAKATFFCIGRNVESHPKLYDRILKEAHAVGNHTYDHIKGWKTDSQTYYESIEKASKAIKSSLFRPPYGRITPRQLKAITKKGFKVIMWNVLSVDWDTEVSEERCLRNVTKYTKEGSIVVFHDSEKAQKNLTYTLPKVLEHFSKLGYSFETIPH